MLTKYRIIRADGSSEVYETDLPQQPGYAALAELIEPIFDGNFEHTCVMAKFDPGSTKKLESSERPRDMFIDADGLTKGLPRNEIATCHYRRANQLGLTVSPKAANPDDLHYVVGTAILFNRVVWF